MKAAKLWSWSETSGVSRSSGTAYGHPLLDHGSPAPRLEQRIICTGKGIIERTGSSLDGRTLTRFISSLIQSHWSPPDNLKRKQMFSKTGGSEVEENQWKGLRPDLSLGNGISSRVPFCLSSVSL
ncbi:uncharacterized protein [Physeter macrocephalus]|uniref:Uncharacterized protein isoform X2 n=1 Tax=Physeter macrocephalus TaxID=9755 RepID=A0A9W2WEK2_PHYMC|nr:uncharacterized protein LOC129391673 isoform X2 [Physeter catodon]